MQKANKQNLLWALVFLFILPACEAMGVEGNLGLGIAGGVLVVIGLGWLALKVLGGVIKIGIVGITILVILVIGLIAWAVTSLMG